MHIESRLLICLFGYLFVLGNTIAQSSCSGDIQVESQADLDQIKTCKVYTGSISIDKASGADLSLPGVTQVNGDINVLNNEALARLSFPQLQGVNRLKLENNRALNKLDLASLTATQSFEIAVHPALPAVSFPAGLSQVSKIAISDTTIVRLEGLNMNRVDEVTIDNNLYLKNLAARNLSEVTNSLVISENSPDLTLDVSHLRSLQQGYFRNLANVSLESLEKVNGDLSFISNKFPSLELHNVTVVGGTLTLSNNNQLKKLAVPELKRLGGALSVANNTQLADIDAFSKLEEIDGSLDLTGSFDDIKLPKLQDVRGGMNVQTTSDKFSCDDMSNLKGGVIKGNSFVCKARIAHPKSDMPSEKGLDASGFSSISNILPSSQRLVVTLAALAISFTC